jgi:hypothetical protein
MIRVRDELSANLPATDLVLSLPLPADTDPAIVSSLKRCLEELVAAVLTKTSFEEVVIRRADDLAAAIIGVPVPAAPLIGERMRRREAMRAVFERGDWLTAEQICELQVTLVPNESQPASEWKRCGRVFSVYIDGKEYFAGYQFDSMCQPLPVIKEILDLLGPVADSWKIAAWFHFPNGWITGTREHEGEPVSPMEALDRFEEVVSAAKHMRGSYIA